MLQYRERAPAPELRPWVECVWAAWDDQAEERPAERIVPDGCPELILHLGDPFAREDTGGVAREQPGAFLAGTLTRPWRLQPGRWARTLGVRFRSDAAGHVLGFSMEETADRETALVDLVGRAAADLLDRARESRSIDVALSVAEGFALARLRQARPARREARPAIGLILSSRGQLRIGDAARTLGWSRRRLERVFLRELGIPPKRYARIVRLNAALSSLDLAERSSAVDLALEAGYFDQAHLLKDFRAMAGAPPSGALASGELSRQFLRPERLRALLLAE